MRGRTGALLSLFAFVFIGMGIVFGMFISPEIRYTWPGVFHLAFVLVGLGILAMAIYGAVKDVSFYTLVNESIIEWGRSDKSEVIGSLRIADLSKIVYTEGIEAGFDLILIDKSGKGHKLSGEYLFSDSEAKRLTFFFRQNFRDIEVIQK